MALKLPQEIEDLEDDCIVVQLINDEGISTRDDDVFGIGEWVITDKGRRAGIGVTTPRGVWSPTV